MEDNKLDIIIEQGYDFVMSMTLYDYNNVVVDLNGSLIEAQMRQFAEANDVFPFEVSHNGVGGRIKLKMPYYLTKQIPFTNGVYDVSVLFPNNTRVCVLYGDVKIITESMR